MCRDKIKILLFSRALTILCTALLGACARPPADIPANPVAPTAEQLAYQQMELIGFVHFTVNTFTDREWGYGDESPAVFSPSALDPEQWAQVASIIGMKALILTAKHHDGFCLWPSRYTAHSVKNSPWQNGAGDVVRAFADACRKYHLKMGLYLSPWDRNHAAYGTPAYREYYRSQLQELLTRYGEVSEVWFDGANGGSGYYGGANETRTIDRATYYQWPEIWALVKKLQPHALIFSDKGPDIRWIGNENGFAGETNWSMLNSDSVVVGAADTHYLNTGDPQGKNWVVGECDVSIRPGWFYHASEDSLIKSPRQLVDIYYRSVGRNGVMLLNVPADKRGLWPANDLATLREFRRVLDETFAINLAADKSVTASNFRLRHQKFAPENILDADNATYWATDDSVTNAALEIDLDELVWFDRILLQEPIRFGQRIAAFSITAEIDHVWTPIAHGTTIGYKRLLRIAPVQARKLRLQIEKSNNIPAISSFGLFKSAAAEASEVEE